MKSASDDVIVRFIHYSHEDLKDTLKEPQFVMHFGHDIFI